MQFRQDRYDDIVKRWKTKIKNEFFVRRGLKGFEIEISDGEMNEKDEMVMVVSTVNPRDGKQFSITNVFFQHAMRNNSFSDILMRHLQKSGDNLSKDVVGYYVAESTPEFSTLPEVQGEEE